DGANQANDQCRRQQTGGARIDIRLRAGSQRRPGSGRLELECVSDRVGEADVWEDQKGRVISPRNRRDYSTVAYPYADLLVECPSAVLLACCGPCRPGEGLDG